MRRHTSAVVSVCRRPYALELPRLGGARWEGMVHLWLGRVLSCFVRFVPTQYTRVP